MKPWSELLRKRLPLLLKRTLYSYGVFFRQNTGVLLKIRREAEQTHRCSKTMSRHYAWFQNEKTAYEEVRVSYTP